MNRRSFLIGIAQVSLAGLLAAAAPRTILATPAGRMLRGTGHGKLYESQDGGQTWQQIVNFGPQYTVLDLFERRGSFYARLGFDKYSFLLQSSDGLTWWTA